MNWHGIVEGDSHEKLLKYKSWLGELCGCTSTKPSSGRGTSWDSAEDGRKGENEGTSLDSINGGCDEIGFETSTSQLTSTLRSSLRVDLFLVDLLARGGLLLLTPSDFAFLSDLRCPPQVFLGLPRFGRGASSSLSLWRAPPFFWRIYSCITWRFTWVRLVRLLFEESMNCHRTLDASDALLAVWSREVVIFLITYVRTGEPDMCSQKTGAVRLLVG